MPSPRTGFLALLLLACAAPPGALAGGQRFFATPVDAAHALAQAMEDNNTAALVKIFGPEGRAIAVSGDPAEDRASRAEFARLAEERLQIREEADGDIIVAGSGERPFPVPLVEQDGRWRFDASRGKARVLAERIAGNERDAIQVCRAYFQAQMEYAARRSGGRGEREYAARIESALGKHDGLFDDGDPRSLSPGSFAQAAAAMFAGKRPAPYRGYWFRILKAQGPDADGGARDYAVKGAGGLSGGFAMLAYPAEYGVSGIRSFQVSQSALVYEKDLGPSTSSQGRRLIRFDPDATWKALALE